MSTISTVFKAGLVVGLLAVTGLPAAAQNVYDPGIQEREFRQQERIQHGINSGQLTPGEAAHLERQQCRIRAAEDALKADGRLTRAERARLARMQDKADRDISSQKHNPYRMY